ncbi:MAG TPA: hypothetical protein VK939_01590 [Longimicrobiales bacterium]|nr:hypothetical protein [Longimicrobiales bacterium]
MKSMLAPVIGLLLAACDGMSVPEVAPDTPGIPASLPPAAAAAGSARAPRDHLPSDRIYYDLTRYEWYARAEPLRHEGRGYQPAGMPVAAPLSEMDQLGAYEGVAYYRRAGADGLLFVPVFDGYWLAFRATAQAPAGAD